MKNIFLPVVLSCCMFAQLSCQHSFNNKSHPAASHNELMKRIMKAPKMNIKTIGILLYDDYFPLDAMGPMAVLSELMGTRVFFVGLKKGLVKNYQMQVQVDTTIAEVDQLDMLVIPGGYTSTYLLTQDTTLLNWIRKIDSRSKITASVCTGAWLLGAAGLLKGKNATTHWYYKAQHILEGYGAHTQNRRYVRDGKYWTSAGVSAGMDMSLAIIKEIRGEEYLQAAMLDLEYNPKPPITGGQPTNSDKQIVDMMVTMYDMGLQPLLDSIEKKKSL
ncbi:MAG TPA: DJ-1/PfpI family protein [Chitinophaga sp.]|uniref:DJ-1/PfpI family protein n=1 Tax=Chitinophaga sp. TaxID=1869181 RepID=UPI002C2CB018|nr:DJ-1/PfpI family protein [Chitinophaga sp.]HVI45042.1 DJ-1/PfpI family protein [Chitinophaga sp.]